MFRLAGEKLLLIEIRKDVAVESRLFAVHLCHEVLFCGRPPDGLLLAGVRNVSRTALGTLFGYAGGREVGADRHDLV